MNKRTDAQTEKRNGPGWGRKITTMHRDFYAIKGDKYL